MSHVSLWISLLLLYLLTNAKAALYLSVANGNDSSSCTQTEPCKTLQHVISQISSEHELIYLMHDYDELIWNEFNVFVDKNITIRPMSQKITIFPTTARNLLKVNTSFVHVNVVGIDFEYPPNVLPSPMESFIESPSSVENVTITLREIGQRYFKYITFITIRSPKSKLILENVHSVVTTLDFISMQSIDGELQVINSTFSNIVNGHVISAVSCTVLIENCEFVENQRVIFLRNSKDFIIQNSTFIRSRGPFNDEIINIETSTGMFADCLFANNTGKDLSTFKDSEINFKNVKFINNEASGRIIFANRGGLFSFGVFFTKNKGSQIIHALYVGVVTIIDSQFDKSSTTQGVLYMDTVGYFSVTSSTFSTNVAMVKGGAIQIYNSLTKIHDCKFIDNNAAIGGALYFESKSLISISESIFKNNIAIDGNSNGGAIHGVQSETIDIEKCIFDSNACFGMGGAVYLGATSAIFRNCNFSDNFANFGGAVACHFFVQSPSSDPRTSICRFNGEELSILEKNSAVNGGAIYSNKVKLEILNNVIIRRNDANFGGGIYISGQTLTFPEKHNPPNPLLDANFANSAGGNIYFDYGTPIPILDYAEIRNGRAGMYKYGNTNQI